MSVFYSTDFKINALNVLIDETDFILNFGVQKYRTTDITSFNVISAVLFCTLILNSSSDPV